MFSDTPNTGIAMGSGSDWMASAAVCKKLRGKRGTPNKKFIAALRRHPMVKAVVMVDEYGTSKTNPVGPLNRRRKPKHVRSEKDERNKSDSLHDVLFFEKEKEPQTLWNRDVMGAINIYVSS
ncbi:hypothetical protein HDU76_004073 [Blyttiomyces sp. JEL0837]|nr:hypothetical protein HDU76_004073 [Blyttiomyces sp. JEL0837]